MAGYSTLPAGMERPQPPHHLVSIAVGCAIVGLVAGLAAGSSNSLYANVGAIPAVKTVAPATIPVRLLSGAGAHNAGMVANLQRPRESLNSEAPALVTPIRAMIGGLAIATIAGIAAAAKLFRPNTASNALAKYQVEEAQWSMNAATAFVGTTAPDFKATAVFDEEFVEIELSQYRGKKYVVLFFYPLDFTFVCPTEITAFSDRAGEFEAIDTEIIGVSVDSQFAHLAWVQMPRNEGGLGEINYPLVADLKKEIAEAYGVLTEEGVALRGLFIIDKEGVIQHATINNLAFGRSVEETLRILEAVQHVQANPDEVCPAGWKKGDKTMKPDPEGSKEYFQAI